MAAQLSPVFIYSERYTFVLPPGYGNVHLFDGEKFQRALAVLEERGVSLQGRVIEPVEVTREQLERPDLQALCAKLQELERAAGSDAEWHTHDSPNPAPELWCGAAGQPSFDEHNELLKPSMLSPEVLKYEVVEALRAVWVFPE